MPSLLSCASVALAVTSQAAAQGYGHNNLLVKAAGESAAIPGWDLQSTAKAGHDLAKLSNKDYDSSSWHHIGSRATVFAGLIEAGVYNSDDLFYSDNLNTKVDYSQFSVPWLYRKEFGLQPAKERHFLLKTNGITSKADIWFNGHEVANSEHQAGAYGGHTYDITGLVKGENGLAIKAYPTDFDKDFGLGFVDWNPYPPDNGTGVWRDVELKETGPLAMDVPRIVTDFKGPGQKSVAVTIKTEVRNYEKTKMSGSITGSIKADDGSEATSVSKMFSLLPGETKTISIQSTINNPEVWWPAQWGKQPLYEAQVAVYSAGALSDISEKKKFGIRHVVSEVNSHNDTAFQVNGRQFLVFGGGYSPDIFLRWDGNTFETQMKYMLDMGMNTVRLEGKQMHPELYEIADRIGLMVISGWECCDKWEAWSYNGDVTATLWNENDYHTANASMRHEASMIQSHASMLAFFVGSDYWPNDRAAAIYVQALHDWDWQNPIICSAAKRGYPEILGPSGMKMDGPYDWVPPNYWYGDQLGAGFGFGSELGSGVGTPEIGSLRKFLSKADMDDLWQAPNKGLFHMSRNVSQFYDRSIYNDALYHRYGKPTSLEDYLLKAQMMDYEATKSEYEGYAANVNGERPATGAIYWMLNNAWPSLHWNQFDYYLHPAGSYFGTKVGARMEHVAYNYDQKKVVLINRSLTAQGARKIDIELIDIHGKTISKHSVDAQTTPDTSKTLASVAGIEKIANVGFLRLVLSDSKGKTLSRNVYWLSSKVDTLNWDNSTWWYTPVTKFVDFTALNTMKQADLHATSSHSYGSEHTVVLENKSDVPAVFIRLNLVDKNGMDVNPVQWSDNYVTLWPHEKMELTVTSLGAGAAAVEISGKNVKNGKVALK